MSLAWLALWSIRTLTLAVRPGFDATLQWTAAWQCEIKHLCVWGGGTLVSIMGLSRGLRGSYLLPVCICLQDVPNAINGLLDTLPGKVDIQGLPFQAVFTYALYTLNYVMLKVSWYQLGPRLRVWLSLRWSEGKVWVPLAVCVANSAVRE